MKKKSLWIFGLVCACSMMLAPARTVLADELDFTTNDMNVLINEEDVLFEGEDVLPDDVVDIAEDNRMYTITYRAGNVGSFDTDDHFELEPGITPPIM